MLSLTLAWREISDSASDYTGHSKSSEKEIRSQKKVRQGRKRQNQSQATPKNSSKRSQKLL
jgi:hypothetical protein